MKAPSEKPAPNSSYDFFAQKEGIHSGLVTKPVSVETIAGIAEDVEALIRDWDSEI